MATDVYVSTMSNYCLCDLAVVPSRRSVQRGSVDTAHSVYVLRVLGKKAIHQAMEST
jgi:hypothetical protein